MTTAPELRPWDRIPARIDSTGKRVKGESEEAWQAFVLYRDMLWREEKPQTRKLVRVAEELKKAVQLIGRWSLKYDWHGRVHAYDVWMDREVQRERVENRILLNRNMAKMGRLLMTKGMNALIQTPLSDLNQNTMLALVKEGVGLQTRAFGEIDTSDQPVVRDPIKVINIRVKAPAEPPRIDESEGGSP